MGRWYIIILLLGGVLKPLQAQEQYHLKLNIEEGEPRVFRDNENFSEKSQLTQKVEDIVQQLHFQGYYLGAVDSIYWEEDTLCAFIYRGPKFDGIDLSFQEEHRERLYTLGVKEGKRSLQSWEESESSIIKQLSEEGYLEPKVTLQYLGVDNNFLKGKLSLEEGTVFYWDSLEVLSQGKIGVRKDFFHRLIQFESGTIYTPKQEQYIVDRLRSQPYLAFTGEAGIYTDQGRVVMQLPLKKRRNNTFEGIIGLDNEGGDFRFNGQLDIVMNNLFGSGKQVDLFWKGIPGNRQQLNFSYSHPAILGTKLDVGLSFLMQKEDSTFLNLRRGLSLSKGTDYGGKWTLAMDWRSSMTFATHEEELANIQSVLLGVGWAKRRLDDLLFPRSGLEYQLLLSVGQRGIDNTLQTEQEGVGQLEWDSDFAFYSPIGRHFVWNISSRAYYLHAPTLYKNELRPLGGINTFRGFEEQAFYTSAYGILGNELRFLMDKYSYLFLFTEMGWIQEQFQGEISRQWPYSIGGGLSLRVKSGKLDLVYAMGVRQGESLEWRNAKLHIRYTSVF
ncbi:BamA/TamA family outer membrane protein [Algivirga pacifica]|uniref:Bacterial surface antigen (D15) domain-containing protein n=1 Tax=Algivirga pacifica TaxID=1162670 RepID=A0ABP9D7K8_9BACT